jgi:transcription elongation factor GreA
MSERSGLSNDEKRRIEVELTQLRQRRDRMVAELQSDLGTVGDRGDAADAIQRSDEVAGLDGQIEKLTWALQGGLSGSAAEGALPDGTHVTLRFPDTGEVRMRVVAIVEETADGAEDTTLTADSPLGAALAGHRPGDTVNYATPHGEQQVVLVAIDHPQ